MDIAILSRGPRLYSTLRLHDACRRRGHRARVLDTLGFTIDTEQENPELYYHGHPIPAFDAVIPRIGASIAFFGSAVLRQFEQMGVFCVNSSQSISVSRDKLRTIQILSRHRIGIPRTVFVNELDEIVPAVNRMGGPPVVIKLLEGTQGTGVMLADSTGAARTIIEKLKLESSREVLLQEFVRESRGRDVRALVVGNRVVAAMRRVARDGEFRSNVHRGARVEPVAIDPEYEHTALRAAQILGLRVAGVDMLEGRAGPMVMEVNSSPGLEGIEKATGIDVADAVLDLVEDEVLFPEVDIRQRLTLQSGYGVLEVPVDERSELCGRALAEADLRERDIMILTILRGSLAIPNPRGSERILSGDTLLCFGKTLTLKSLAPRVGVRRRRTGGAETRVPERLAGDEPAPDGARPPDA